MTALTLIRSLSFTCVLILAASVQAAGTLYKSVGADGRVVYSDTPPAQGKVEKTLKFTALPASSRPPTAGRYAEILQRPVQTASATLFTTQTCGYCKKARAHLNAAGFRYVEIDVDTASGDAAFRNAGGTGGVPLLVDGGTSLQGYSRAAYDTHLESRR